LKKNNKVVRGILLFAVVFGAVMLMAVLTSGLNHSEPDELVYGEFIQMVGEDKVSRAVVVETQLVGLYSESSYNAKKFPNTYDFITYIPSSDLLFSDLKTLAAEKTGKPLDEVTSADVESLLSLDTQPQPQQSWIVSVLPYILTLVVLGGLWFLFMRQMSGANNRAMSFGKTRARLADEKARKVSFKDVAGAEEEKEELEEIVEFLKNPKKFYELGARIPKGVLLVGPPGTGKTLLAKAVAGEAGVPFYSISGSDFVEMYVGVGASRVRDMFEQAKRNSPCIVFIDEIDAVGRHRGAGLGGGHDEREQTLNQLLVEMDGFDANEGIIIVAATNRPDILDPALLRPGRFDRRITVNYPDVNGREAILKVHSRKKPLADDVKLDVIAKRTPFFTGADLENVMNEAALLAARNGQKQITMWNVTEAINRVEMGPEKRSRKVTKEDKDLVACHESGHAIVAWSLEDADPVHEVSIIPRGAAGGYTQTLPEKESYFVTSGKLRATLAMAMGGYMAEKLVFGDITAGSDSDIKQASSIARRMVTEWGMSAKIGPVFLGGAQEVFIGRTYGQTHNYSETVATLVDEEVRLFIQEAMDTASEAIRSHMDKLKRLSSLLLEREKINGNEFRMIMKGEELPQEKEITEKEDEKSVAPSEDTDVQSETASR
jgi:cell division protease FtsH